LDEYSRREKRKGWGRLSSKVREGSLTGQEWSQAKPASGSGTHLTVSSRVANVVHFYFAG
ncbi:MAG: hypothetical protein WAQ77_16040, partial [Candidatus Acidiferrum sp.]